jgi:hypothetical protein
MTRKTSKNTAYLLRITLDDITPAIWRRFGVPGQISLDRLHDIIQIVMGWQDCHLHRFDIDGRSYTEEPEDSEMEGYEESSLRLSDLVSRVDSEFGYEYDFGDGWYHTLAVEGISLVPKGQWACIGCVDGKRACPPEDVGGTDGYREFLAALADPEDPEHDSYLTWCGGSFDPKAFDARQVNLELGKYARWSRPRPLVQELTVQTLSYT